MNRSTFYNISKLSCVPVRRRSRGPGRIGEPEGDAVGRMRDEAAQEQRPGHGGIREENPRIGVREGNDDENGAQGQEDPTVEPPLEEVASGKATVDPPGVDESPVTVITKVAKKPAITARQNVEDFMSLPPPPVLLNAHAWIGRQPRRQPVGGEGCSRSQRRECRGRDPNARGASAPADFKYEIGSSTSRSPGRSAALGQVRSVAQPVGRAPTAGVRQ